MRENIKEVDNILDQTFPIHNHGFVRLVDYMGSDKRIIQAARVSFGSGEKSPEEDRKLIHYLLKNEHGTPFEKVVFEFHCKMPIFVARQWIRHRIGSFNEISGRYSVMKDEFFVPNVEDIRPQSKINKQGRDENAEISTHVKKLVLASLEHGQKESYDRYQDYLNDGITKELARINLPLSLYTEWYWTVNLRSLFNFINLRFDSHAQKEIRVYGEKIADIAKLVVPIAWEAFEEHILYAKKLSRTEWKEIQIKLNLFSNKVNHDNNS